MKKLNSQSGRSMVEMLGVLAIIGVLSVGGIAGYSLSMRRHRANGVVDFVSKYALNAYTKCHQLVNDQSNSYVEDYSDCNAGNYSYDCDSDDVTEIGPTPAGVSAIYFREVVSTDEGSDKIVMDVDFSDQKLCQAVASVVGRTCSSDRRVVIEIKQN